MIYDELQKVPKNHLILLKKVLIFLHYVNFFFFLYLI